MQVGLEVDKGLDFQLDHAAKRMGTAHTKQDKKVNWRTIDTQWTKCTRKTAVGIVQRPDIRQSTLDPGTHVALYKQLYPLQTPRKPGFTLGFSSFNK